MLKLDTFEKLEKALEHYYDNDDNDGDFYDDKVTKEDTEALKNIIVSWGEPELKNAHSVLHDYYAMKVPSQMIREILSEDIELAYEVYTDGVRDTCQRDLMIDATLRYMGLRSWPMNGEGSQAMKDFVKELKEKAQLFGIEFIIDVEEAAK